MISLICCDLHFFVIYCNFTDYLWFCVVAVFIISGELVSVLVIFGDSLWCLVMFVIYHDNWRFQLFWMLYHDFFVLCIISSDFCNFSGFRSLPVIVGDFGDFGDRLWSFRDSWWLLVILVVFVMFGDFSHFGDVDDFQWFVVILLDFINFSSFVNCWDFLWLLWCSMMLSGRWWFHVICVDIFENVCDIIIF